MSTAYTIIGLNALCMFFGTWLYRCRLFSIYFTFLACFVQFILLMVSASMLFSNYSNLCRLSTTNTIKNFRWTLHDDFKMTTDLWILSLFLMFFIVMLSLC